MKATTFRILPLAILFATLPLAGCLDDEEIIEPEAGVGGELFRQYVALGNSITAGFQSGGINANTQQEAYPVLLAEQAGVRARFNAPLLAFPGCPPPLADPLSGQTIAPGVTCLLRETPGPGPLQNLAVPGALIASAFDIVPAANALTTLILGGRTPIEAMIDAEPSLVSAWLGNNDALGAALAGTTALLTPLPEFQGSIDGLVAAIRDDTPAQMAILIGVVDPTLAPALQVGTFFWAARHAGLLPKPVSDNCAPITGTGLPNPLTRNVVSLRVLTIDAVPEISCADDAPFVLPPAEQLAISQRVIDFNAATASAAAAEGWIYLDPNLLLGQFLNQPDMLRKCQGLATAATAEQIQAAVLTTCPGPTAPNFFGALISLDGVHPSGLAHQVVTNAIIEALNAEQNLNIPLITMEGL